MLDMRKLSSSTLYKKKKCYHIYNRGHRKNRVFRNVKDYEQLVYSLSRFLIGYDIVLICYCLMPNHYHMLLRLGESKTDISRFMQSLFTSYGSYFNRKYHLVGGVFQGRFQAREIEDRYDLINMVEYIRKNPLEACLVKKPEDYQWFYLKKGWRRLKV